MWNILQNQELFLFENIGAREPDKVIEKKVVKRYQKKKVDKYFPSKRMFSQFKLLNNHWREIICPIWREF